MHADQAVTRVAAAQHGVVTREQLAALGLSRSAIEWWLRRGRLHRVHRGVYLLGHPVAPPFALGLAAVLACGEDAVMSHRAACVLWQLLRAGDDDTDVTVAGNRRHRQGIRVHRAGLPPQHRTRRHGIPVTTVPRTLLDFAEQARGRELERAFDEALTQRRTSLPQLRTLLDQSHGRRGTPAIEALLERQGGPAVTRSEAEEIFLALIRRGGLPAPEVNVRVGRHELDFFWRPQRFNVEVDGYRWHRDAYERDRVRDAELQALGIATQRVTWRQLVETPEAVLVRVTAGFAPRSAAAP